MADPYGPAVWIRKCAGCGLLIDEVPDTELDYDTVFWTMHESCEKKMWRELEPRCPTCGKRMDRPKRCLPCRARYRDAGY